MNRSNKAQATKIGIRWKLFGFMMLFLVLLLGLLWLFQVVFFGEIYKSVRIAEIKKSADIICQAAESDNTEIRAVTEGIARDAEVSVLVFDETGNIIANEKTFSDSVIHGMSAKSIYMLYNFAVRDGGEKLSRFNLSGFQNIRPDADFPSPSVHGESEAYDKDADKTAESVIFTKVVYSERRGRDIIVMLNTTISPVASTVRTLQRELIIISVVMVLLAALLSFVLARRISNPIVKINDSAKRLAVGDYAADFTAGGYREISELSSTLSYAADELSKTGALQRELISNISHDLRTPLTMIAGYAEVMRDIPGENTPENVQVIIDEARRLTSLVNDMLDISRIQSGTQELDITEFNLTDTVRETIGRFSKLTGQNGYKIEFVSDFEAVVMADRSRILQVIYNFINNAITHSGADKTVLVTQKLVERDGQRRVRIEVTDHGDGISEKDLPNIWDRYYKVDKLHKRAETGSGLGLSIVKGILELHHAEYGVESTEGVGSTFWFEL